MRLQNGKNFIHTFLNTVYNNSFLWHDINYLTKLRKNEKKKYVFVGTMLF